MNDHPPGSQPLEPPEEPDFDPNLWRRFRYRRRSHPSAVTLKRRDDRKAARSAARSQVVEWHALDADQRAEFWRDLVGWVEWLYQRYELSVEERLPHCWADHPGLIEELRALKAWRDEIYAGPQPNGQAARYWHVEMRQIVTNAAAFYASGCRAGHRGPNLTPDRVRQLRARWLDANPAAGIPPGILYQASDHDGMYKSADAMKEAIVLGDAQPLSATMHDFVRHDGSWWRADGTGWFRVTDAQLSDQFDASATRMAAADAAVARRHGYAPKLPDMER